MRRGKPERVGISTVVGTMFFIVAMLAGLAAIAQLYSLSVQTQTAAQSVANLQAAHNKESLSYRALSNGTLTVSNTGPSGSTILAMVLKFANGTVYEFAPSRAVSSGGLMNLPSLIPTSGSCGLSSCLSKYSSILSSTNTGDSIGLVTSLGNTFWLKPAQAVQTNNPQLTTQITFDASGADPFGSNPVLVVDGITYALTQLPVTFSWFSGTQHSYSYLTLSSGAGTRVGISMVRGLVSTPSGKVTATSAGSVETSYTTQYLLSVSGGGGIVFAPPSRTNDGWFNPGTTVYVTTNNVWNLVSSQSRADLVSWSVDAATATSVTRSGSGTFTTGGIVMNAPHTVNFNSVTQYFLQLQPELSPSGSVPPLAVSYQYTAQSTVSQALANPGFESGALSPWSASCGYGSATVSSATVHSGSYSAYGSYPNDAGSCEIAQGFAAPPGASILSVSGSAYVYFNGVGSAWIHNSCGPYWGIGASSANTWQQLSRSDSCPTGTSYVTFSLGVQGNCVIKCYYGSAYWDDASFSYTYSMQYTGTTATTLNSFQLNGATVTYQYLASYSFPGGSTGRQIQITLPSSETLSQILVGSGPSTISSSQYTISGSTISIPDSTIATYGSIYTIVATSSGSYAFASSGSQTSDNWYDAGSSASISAAATGAISFSSWGGSPTIASPSSLQTTVVMNSYYTITAKFNIGP